MSIQGSGEHPAFPAQWLYGLYDFVLVTGFLATIACGLLRSLDASTGASDPNDFTVRCSPFVSRAAASIAPCPSFATMANAPLMGQDGRKEDSNFGKRKADYFFDPDWTPQITLNLLVKFVRTRTTF